MKCPYCEAPMTDEQVFCEKCGKERQLVPVFEAEIDETIENAITGIAVDLANTQEMKPVRPERILTEFAEENASEEEELNTEPVRKGTSTRFLVFMIGCVIAVVLLVVLVVMIFQMRQQSSYDFHIKKAEEMSRVSNYEQMLVHAENARDLAPNSSDAKMLIARAYEGLGNVQYEREMLEDLLAVDSAYAPAYELLVPIYEEGQQYQKIADLLSLCKEQTVLDKYVDYLATAPQMSEEPGTYDEAVVLKLIAPGSGKIYYSQNGSDPAEKGSEYRTPLILHSGKYTVKAVYVNSYGICSPVSEADYLITEQKLLTPEISLESGTYTQPQYITIESPDDSCLVYYTTDGSEPGMESTLYEGPIPIPLGESRFAFVMYDANGIPGEITYAQYHFEMNLAFTGEQAANMLIQTLITQGILTDADGHMADVEGRKQYRTNTIIEENGQYYYLLDEIFVPVNADDEMDQKTGQKYAVSVTTGESFQAQRNMLGTFDLRRMQ